MGETPQAGDNGGVDREDVCYGEEAGAEGVGAPGWEDGNAVEPALFHGKEEGSLGNNCLPDVGAVGGRVRAVLYGGVAEGRRKVYQ